MDLQLWTKLLIQMQKTHAFEKSEYSERKHGQDRISAFPPHAHLSLNCLKTLAIHHASFWGNNDVGEVSMSEFLS